MSRASRILLALGSVALLSTCLQLFRAPGAAAGTSAKENGDINGDGRLDVSDAVSLLSFLFQGGPAPAAIDCGTPPPEPARIRFLNDLTCNSQKTLSKLKACGGLSISRLTNQAVGDCQDFAASDSCTVAISTDTPCGSFALCEDIGAAAGFVYDFVFTVNATATAPIGLLFVQPLGEDGSCPPFPTPGTQSTQVMSAECAGNGAGAALEPAAWGRAGAW